MYIQGYYATSRLKSRHLNILMHGIYPYIDKHKYIDEYILAYTIYFNARHADGHAV